LARARNLLLSLISYGKLVLYLRVFNLRDSFFQEHIYSVNREATVVGQLIDKFRVSYRIVHYRVHRCLQSKYLNIFH
jgi:hypothetical protein